MIFASIWFIGGQLYAATSDAMQMRVPNTLILYLVAGYLITTVLGQSGWGALALNAAVGIAILAAGAILLARGWMGGGDVKLLAVTGLWLGPAATPAFLLLTALAGGLLTLTLVTYRALGAHSPAGARPAARRDPAGRVPYAIAIAAAAIATVFLRPNSLLTG